MTVLARFGIQWQGPQQPIAVPMDDGYWTPWHLANAENERLAKQRDELARWIVLRGQPHRDGACSHCYPKHVAPGFVCAFHVAEAIAAEQPKPAGGA